MTTTYTLEQKLEAMRVMAEFMRAFRRMYAPTDRVWVYAVQAGRRGPVKIGVSEAPDKRIETLQVSHYEKLRPVASWWGSREQERFLHRHLAQWRIRGEWFQPVDEVLGICEWIGNCFEPWDVDYPPVWLGVAA